MYPRKKPKGEKIPNILFGAIITVVLAGYIFGWRGALAVGAIFLLAGLGKYPPPGKIERFLNKLDE